jgi:hypothetical protein
MTFDLINIWRFSCYIYNPSLVPIKLQHFKLANFTCSAYLQLDLRWLLTLVCARWPHYHMKVPCYICKLSLVQIGLQLFKWANFTCSAYLTTWPEMTFDFSIWPLTSLTYEGSHVTSITNVWFQLNFNLAKLNLPAYFKPWPQMTFDLRMWPFTSLKYEGFQVTSINQVWFWLDFNLSNESQMREKLNIKR